MANSTGTENNIWPLPKFRFNVTFKSATVTIQFSEVSGLDAEAQISEYRDGIRSSNLNIKMPALQKFNNLTLKRGVVVGNNEFFDWWAAIKADTIARDTVTIELRNETNATTVVWTLLNAWPTKVTSTDMKSDADEAAIETLELAFESITIANNNDV